MKKLQQLSLLSMSPNPLISIRIDVTIMSTSSSLNKSGMSPKKAKKENNTFKICHSTKPNNTKASCMHLMINKISCCKVDFSITLQERYVFLIQKNFILFVKSRSPRIQIVIYREFGYRMLFGGYYFPSHGVIKIFFLLMNLFAPRQMIPCFFLIVAYSFATNSFYVTRLYTKHQKSYAY